MKRTKKRTEFQKVQGVKKVIRCISCGEKITVQNFNQLKCAKCGYRGSNKESA